MQPTHTPSFSAIPAVEVQHLHFSYDKTEEILIDVNLTVHTGDFLAVIGPNGGGKTTLLKILLGLLTPASGSIKIFGKKPQDVRSSIGYVPQFATLNSGFPAKALDIVLMGGAQHSWLYGTTWPRDRRSKEKAAQLLTDVGLDGFEYADIGDLSGGQRQRVLVARALMGRGENAATTQPYLLILDEPTANIDPQGKFCFYEFLHDIHKNLGIIVVSHDLLAVTNLFTAVALVNRHVRVSTDQTLTPDMLNTFFGYHGHDCPVASVMRSVSDIMDANHTLPEMVPTHPHIKTE